MKKIALTLGAAMVLASSAQAGPACEYLRNHVALQSQSGDELQMQDQDGACLVQNGQWSAGFSSMLLAFDELVLRDEGLEKLSERQAIPDAMDLRVGGIYVLTGRLPGQDYVMRLQAKPMDFSLKYKWDSASAQLDLEQLRLRSKYLREVRVQAQFGIKSAAGRALGPDELEQAELKSLNLYLDNQNLIQTMIMPALVLNMSMYEDPRPAVEKALLAARTSVQLMPDSVADRDSRNALLAFIAQLPAPEGRLSLEMNMDPPWPATRLESGLSVDQMRKLMSGLKVKARFDTGQEVPSAYVWLRDRLRYGLKLFDLGKADASN
ncbi:hypothetical protein [Alcaligenes parafaecalis]|uniref:Uncharacterized protein n=1 Tax=Alcaligenes parafaecalis TaxID=171260 RepID=A0ABT3VNB5_9BURK|nr:hypothetical protein [Alcaligenes parafaecalis]MCX5465007.1 hypothetical protein [Alcaligenes parafaecalis]